MTRPASGVARAAKYRTPRDDDEHSRQQTEPFSRRLACRVRRVLQTRTTHRDAHPPPPPPPPPPRPPPPQDVGTTSGKGAFRLATGNFTSRTTGYSAFDEGPIATVGGSAPSYGVLFFDLEFVSKEFRGLVAVDSAGYVVWYHNRKASVQAFDQFPNYEIVIQVRDPAATVHARYITCTRDI